MKAFHSPISNFKLPFKSFQCHLLTLRLCSCTELLIFLSHFQLFKSGLELLCLVHPELQLEFKSKFEYCSEVFWAFRLFNYLKKVYPRVPLSKLCKILLFLQNLNSFVPQIILLRYRFLCPSLIEKLAL